MLVFDIETDGIENYTVIHTMTILDTATQEYERYDLKAVPQGIKRLANADIIIGHNVIGYDIPVIKKLYPWFTHRKVLDTMVWSRLAFADIKEIDFNNCQKWQMPKKLIGSHSLESWGFRLRVYKDNFGKTTDWKTWSQEMSDYCEQDVRVTYQLLQVLQKKNISAEALELEHQVATVVQRQVKHGFLFDIPKAEKLYATLIARKDELTKELQTVFKPWYVKVKEVLPKKNNSKRGITAGCPYTNIKLVEFNPASRHHVAYQLKKLYNWKPKEFTPNGEPKIDDEVLETLDYPEAKLLAEYFMVNKRLGQLADGDKGWLRLVKPDSRIHGGVITNGAVTGRMTHTNPNIAQVPKASDKVPYGKQCRELFHVAPGYKQVGCDASGLELRCLAHYMARYDGGAYGKVILEGDIHTVNQVAAGLPTRDDAKRFIYAYLYGAGDEKIGEIIGKGKKEGRKLKKQFLEKTPALRQLKEAITTAIEKKGYLVGLDGRHLKIRSAHAALNTLLQSAGALVMKKALVILDTELQRQYIPGQDYEFCANIHDEWQIEVREELAATVGQMAADAIFKAGDYFKFRCPLAGEYKIGNNWMETH